MELPLNLRLAFRNIFRNRVRSAITLAAISFGCISLILAGGFFQDTFLRMREAYIHAHLGHIQVYQKGYMEKGNSRPFDFLIKNPENIEKLIASIDHVQYVTPRINFSALVSTGETTMSVMAQGIDPEGENKMNVITEIEGVSTSLAFSKGTGLAKSDMFEVNVGRGLAKGIDLDVGNPLILLSNTIGGSLNGMDVTVKGIFYTASEEYDNYTMRLPIPLARKLLQTDAAQTLVVVLDKTDNTDPVLRQLTELFREKNLSLELKPWYEMADFYNKTVDLYGRQFLVLKIIIAVIVILSIFNTISMSVWERTKEIGTIMAMGFKKWEIMRLFLLEGFVLGVIGGILGTLGGCILAYVISLVGIPMPPPPGSTTAWTASIQLVPSVILTSLLISIVAALVSSFYPSYKASRLIIADALRYA
jgi:putative ABC transport system permease protein